MEDWLRFDYLHQYKQWIESQGTGKFPFMVGVFNERRFGFDQSGYFFSRFTPEHPQSKKELPVSSVLGEHTYRSLLLSAEHLFEEPVEFIRQGDMLHHMPNVGLPEIEVPPTHWVVSSQTCTIANDAYGSILPAYEEPTLLCSLVKLGIRPPNPPDAIRANKKPRLLALPPSDFFNFDHSLIIDLGQSYSISTDLLKKCQPAVSMTFPANAYLSCRLAMYLFRDVECWDDMRQPK